MHRKRGKILLLKNLRESRTHPARIDAPLAARAHAQIAKSARQGQREPRTARDYSNRRFVVAQARNSWTRGRRLDVWLGRSPQEINTGDFPQLLKRAARRRQSRSPAPSEQFPKETLIVGKFATIGAADTFHVNTVTKKMIPRGPECTRSSEGRRKSGQKSTKTTRNHLKFAPARAG